ncbi:hypothetical protein DB347_13945 [Opitutaceae bacterium EW11]|nr:hypothetical protein DB347_13945 [Opitutaceae bacterium EW11]
MTFSFRRLIRAACLLTACSALALAADESARSASKAGKPIQAVVVSTLTNAGTVVAPPSPDAPVTYRAFDAGFIEAGDVVAGDREPSAGDVAGAFRAALNRQGYRAASEGASPQLALVYHWGAARQKSMPTDRAGYLNLGQEANFRCRIFLVAPPRLANAIWSDIEAHSIGQNSLRNLFADWQEAKQLADDDRYFFIVTAYDWADLAKGKATALWRTRMSAAENSGYMAQVIPALARGSGPYVGRTVSSTSITAVDVDAWDRAELGSVEPFPAPVRLKNAANPNLLVEIARKERLQLLGEARSPQQDPAWEANPPDAAPAPRQIEVAVAARQTLLGEKASAKSSGRRIACVVFDGGYVGSASAAANEKLPDADAVAAALRATLTANGFTIAADGDAPDVAIVYHWGTVRRLYFPPPARTGAEPGDGLSYFVMVTAYDHAQLMRGHVRPLWRTRFGAAIDAGAPSDALSSMAAGIGPYLGRKMAPENASSIRIPLRAVSKPTPPGFGFPAPGLLIGGADEKLLVDVVSAERRRIEGDKTAPGIDADIWETRAKDRNAAAKAALPPSLQQLIERYQQDKRALQDELSSSIRSLGTDQDPSRTIDAFNKKNAGRIAALGRTREAIRSEFAQFAAKNQKPGTEKSIDALLEEFMSEASDLGADTFAKQP